MAKSALRLTALRLGTTLMPRVVTIMITRMIMVTTAVNRTNRLGW
jgi:hypothetical protein